MSKPLGGSKRPTLRRSKDGCLTCRRKRKKCDEKWPVCSRCDHTRSSCVWPPPRPIPALGIDLPMDIQAFLNIQLGNETNNMVSPGLVANPMFTCSTTDSHTNGSVPLNDVNPAVWDQLLPYSISSENQSSLPFGSLSSGSSSLSTTFCAAPGSRVTKSMAARMWEYAHDLGPRILWPPRGCINCDELDPEGVAPLFRLSVTALVRVTPVEPVFQDVFDFYSTFLTRLFYDYTLTSDKISNWIVRKFNTSNSAKYGMLCMATLFRSDYEGSVLTTSWRKSAQEVYNVAIEHLSRDLEDPRLSPWEKLTGLIPIMDYEFHTGEISKYFSHVTLALPLVKAVVGGDTIDLLKLGGEEMFDVNMWAWCDILDSMATSSPTRLKYQSDLERAAQPGTEESTACHDKGIEWLYGIPNVLAVLLARTSALRHSKLLPQEKASKGAELEQLARKWQIRPLETKNSRLRVARVGAQEIWRHTAILYVHHAIFKSRSNHPVVKDSVKNIVKIASTLEPGSNPDSFLYLPYFISAFYAASQKDRYFMRSRMINCGK
ncbi:hypothetical protein OPQ81_000119 [Rhizoctonia solani]|nr:hypothetical protein OPQ81_000119 [Rhizoctonia solani]